MNPSVIRKAIRFLVCYVTLMVAAGWIALTFLDWKAAYRLVQEDGVIQDLQFVLVLLAALIFLKLATDHGKHYDSTLLRNAFFVLFAFCFLVAMEEISWGQRIVGWSTPESINEINAQHETTVHNLSGIQPYRHWGYILIGIIGVVASCLSIRNWDPEKTLPFLLPPLFFVLPSCVVMLGGLLFEVAIRGELEWLYPSLSHLARGASFAGSTEQLVRRFSEIVEFFIYTMAFSYAALKYSEVTIKAGSKKQRQLNSA